MKLVLNRVTILAVAAACFVAGMSGTSAAAPPPKRPNILVILADDLAYSDLSPYGGEIATPNLARLAKSGVTFTYFHTSPMCSPSRAMLLTGVDHHQTGFGAMAEFQGANQKGQPGYEGYLNDRVLTLAERFRAVGYRTSMAGKWHLGAQSLPHKRGFEDSVILLEGASSHFSDTGYASFKPKVTYMRDGAPLTLPKDFYSSDFYGDEAIRQIGDRQDKPFFAYLAFTAPHWPLHAPPQSIAKYEGKYAMGWDALRKQRFAALKASGTIAADATMPPGSSSVPDWDTLSPAQKTYQAKLMTVYAAMVDRLDWNVGRVLDHLERTGQLENTIIMFASDNGPEALDFTSNSYLKGATEWIDQNFSKSVAALGSAQSYAFYGEGWAQSGAAAHRYYKTFVTEGGLHSPFIISWPAKIPGGGKTRAFTTLLEITPTLMEAAAIKAPAKTSVKLAPLGGKSMLPYLTGSAQSIYKDHDGQGFELFANQAYIAGDWKILRMQPPVGDGSWKLFNLARDPGELNDLSSAHPALFRKLMKRYERYAKSNNVILRTEPYELFQKNPATGHQH